MKKTKLIALLVGMMIVFGCAGPAQEQDTQDVPKTTPTPPDSVDKAPEPSIDKIQTEADTEIKPEEPLKAVEDAAISDKCESDSQPHELKSIELTMFNEPLSKTDKGITFRVFPMDKEDKPMPITGNLRVSFWNTKQQRGETIEETEIYLKSYNLKADQFASDCGSAELFIDFGLMRKEGKYKYVKEDDMGIINFQLKRVGSGDFFEKKYVGEDMGFRVFPDPK